MSLASHAVLDIPASLLVERDLSHYLEWIWQQYFSDIIGGYILGLIISGLIIKLTKVGEERKNNGVEEKEEAKI